MALPSITQNPARFGKVTWTALAAVIDSALDPDDVPDDTAVEGLIIFKPSTSLITYTNAVPKYTRILANRQVALKDAQIDEQGRKYVKLEANVLGANPAVFTWKATFVVAYAGVTVRLPDAEFTLAPDQEIDLTDYLDPGSPITSIPGLSVTELQQMIADFGSGLVTKDFADSEYLQQNATPGQVYATDWSGNQSPMSYDSGSWPDYSFVQRDAGGVVRGGDPVDLNDMVTKGFADKKYGQVSITVASSDTPIALRRRADYICSGTNDLATIQQALDALPDDNAVSGEVLLLAGNYNDGSGGTLSIGSQSSSSKNPRKVLRFQRGARINVSNRTGRIAVIKVESPDCQVINPNVAGNSAFGNGTALAIGGDVATFGGRWDRVCNRVLVYEPILSNMETALEFSSIDGGPGVGGSTGDCKVYGGYYFQNKTGIRAAGYTNTVYAPCLANNNRPIWVESRRSEAQLRVHDPAIVGWNEVGIAVDGGFGSVFSNVWMEQNPASGSSATEAIRMGLSGTVRASGVRFTGSTHIQLVAEQYAIKYIGAIGTEVEELVLSTSGAVPSVAVARNELPSTSKNNRIRKITFGPNAIPSHTVLSIDAAAWGELFIDRVPGLVGADGFSTRRNPSTRASSSPVVRKTVDVSKTSDTTLAVDSDLTVNLNAGTTYSIEGIVFFDASQAGDFKMALSVSAANGSISWVGLGPASSHTSGVGVSSVTTQRCTSGFVQAWGGAGAGVVIGVFIKGVVTVQDLATLTLSWAQNTADATPSILKAGSYLELTPLT